MDSAFFFAPKSKSAFLVTSTAPDELVTMAWSSIMRLRAVIDQMVVFKQNSLWQRNLVAFMNNPHIIFPFPWCFSPRMLFKCGRTQLIWRLNGFSRSSLNGSMIHACQNKIHIKYQFVSFPTVMASSIIITSCMTGRKLEHKPNIFLTRIEISNHHCIFVCMERTGKEIDGMDLEDNKRTDKITAYLHRNLECIRSWSRDDQKGKPWAFQQHHRSDGWCIHTSPRCNLLLCSAHWSRSLPPP